MSDINPLTQLSCNVGLRRAGKTASAEAYLLLGGRCEQWLAEIMTWGLPLQSVRLLPVPASERDPSVIGVLAIPQRMPARVLRGLPYACRARRLYLPADAQLYPPMSDDEVTQSFPWPVAIMHPTIGLVAASEQELVPASELIIAEEPQTSRWNDALPGVFVEPRIRSLQPVPLPGAMEILRLARDDIGGQPASDLPSTEDESFSKRAARRTALTFIRALRGTLPGAAGGVGSGGLFGKLGAWADKQARQLQEQLNATRDRELHRLMKMLEKNPDEGLRYALPLNSAGSSRGTVTGGSYLPPRETNFSLSRLFGSNPISSWHTSDDSHEKLRRRYHELATRELSLGRFRRAAYIYGELLGDFHNAANALQQGKFYREAAVLYRDKLNNVGLAAACLERGGLLTEAAQLYIQLRQHEKAGDLYRKLGDEEQAVRAYREAVNQMSMGNPLGAAKLLEEKLHAPDEAYACLIAAWPSHSQAALCLRESFYFLQRHGKHADAEQRLRAFRSSAKEEMQPYVLADALADVGSSYAQQSVRRLANDTARILCGYALSNPSLQNGQRSFLQIVSRTCSEDRLLYRDTVRFAESNKPPLKPAHTPKATTTPSLRKKATITEVTAFNLDPKFRWSAAVSTAKELIGLGVRGDKVSFAWWSWNGSLRQMKSRFKDAEQHRFAMGIAAGELIVAPLQTEARLERSRFAAFDHGSQLTVAREDLLPPGRILAFDIGEDGNLHILYLPPDEQQDATAVYLCRTLNGITVATKTISLDTSNEADLASVWVKHARERLAFTCGSRLYWTLRDVIQDPIDLPQPAISMSRSVWLTAFRVAVGLQEGGCVLIWPQQGKVERFASSIQQPQTLITADGLLVAVGHQGGSVSRVENGRIYELAAIPHQDADCAALLHTSHPRQFAALMTSGRVTIYQVH